ncbi:MAG: hypothetical protein IPK28_10315 [Devosia sp.]|nr:hypothetical protein [Devosia sp.]
MTAVRTNSRQHQRAIKTWLALVMLSLALLVLSPPVRAQDESRTEAQIGPFQAMGEWTAKGAAVTGKGEIVAPWGGSIGITATYDTERETGRWQGKLRHPMLGDISVASGRITEKALTFDHKVDIGAGTVTFRMLLTPDELVGEGQGPSRSARSVSAVPSLSSTTASYRPTPPQRSGCPASRCR